MRIEIDKYGNRNEYSDDGKWLYQDRGENDRYFTNVVYLGKDEEPWKECTDEEKHEYEKSKEPVSETVEPVEQSTE